MRLLPALAIVLAASVQCAFCQQTSIARENEFITHLNGGATLAKNGKNAEAIEELKKAQAIKPNDPRLLVNLGQAYQLSGKNLEALEQYKKYLNLYPKGPHVGLITNMFKVMQTQVMLSGGKTSQGQDNYLQEAMAGAGGRWSESQMPVPVYIFSGKDVEGYKDTFADIVKDAFKDWSTATDGKFRVAYVDSPEKAKITCKWTANLKDLANPQEGGHAAVRLDMQRSIVSVEVLLLTHNSQLPAHVSADNYMRYISLHEIGHAIGLASHSSQPGDIMFSLMNYDVSQVGLSDRDKKTALMLYSAAKAGAPAGTAPLILQVTPGQPPALKKQKQ